MVKVAPTFKYATDTTSGGSAKHGAQDINYGWHLLAGDHSTDAIQASVIEGLQKPYSSVVTKEGSTFVTRNNNGTVTYSGSVAQTALQTAFTAGGRIFINEGVYPTTSTMTVPSNTHIQCHVNAEIRGAGGFTTSHPLLRNADNTGAPGNSYIIIEGGLWNGNVTDASNASQIYSTTANLHFDYGGFIWLNRVRSINSQSETIKIRNCTNAWVTECYTNRAALQSDGIGKAGVNAASNSNNVIIAHNIFEDSGGEAIGSYNNSGRTKIFGNICRYVTYGRNHILNEGNNSGGLDVRNTTIIGNEIFAHYYGIHCLSTTGCTIEGNRITTQPSTALELNNSTELPHGILIDGVSSRFVIVGNNIRDCQCNGIQLSNQFNNSIVSNNVITNSGQMTTNTYSGINLTPGGGTCNNVKISDNLISDDTGTPTQKNGIVIKANNNSIFNLWVHNNQIYNLQTSTNPTILLDWSNNGRLRDDTRFYNNTAFNPYGVVTNPFNNTHSEVGIPKGSTTAYTFAAAPTASTEYAVVMSPITMYISGGTGVSITVKDKSGGTSVLTGQTSPAVLSLTIGNTINFGGFSVAPTVNVVGI